MKKKMLALAAVLCCATLFNACDKNRTNGNEEKNEPQVTYSFYIQVPESAADQQDVVKMTVTAPDNQGQPQENDFSPYVEEMTLKSNAYKDLPTSLTFTIKETLLSDRPVQDRYKMGFYYKLVVTSTDSKEYVIDYKMLEKAHTMTVPAENLSALYPATHTFKADIDKDGNVNLYEL